jgi:hypothetical protein
MEQALTAMIKRAALGISHQELRIHRQIKKTT